MYQLLVTTVSDTGKLDVTVLHFSHSSQADAAYRCLALEAPTGFVRTTTKLY